MNQYVTGTTIKELREKNKITQVQLAEKLGVSDIHRYGYGEHDIPDGQQQ